MKRFHLSLSILLVLSAGSCFSAKADSYHDHDSLGMYSNGNSHSVSFLNDHEDGRGKLPPSFFSTNGDFTVEHCPSFANCLPGSHDGFNGFEYHGGKPFAILNNGMPGYEHTPPPPPPPSYGGKGPVPTPEPSVLVLLITGLAALVLLNKTRG
jgi:hypothetical protein